MNIYAQENEPHAATIMRRWGLSPGAPSTIWLSRALIGVMTVTLVALFWFPIKRVFAYAPINFNEGWNTYKQAMVAKGIPLYGAPQEHFTGTTGYSPLSFHLIGWLGRPNNFIAAGRLIALLCLLATGILAGLIVKRAGGSTATALFSALLYAIGIVVIFPSRVGMNDPQLLGEALSATGLYFYVRNSNSKRMLCLSALAFSLAVFTKQTLIAIPVAVGIDSLLRSRRSFATWATALVVMGGLFAAVTFWIDGRHFLVHLLSPRAYLYGMAAKNIHTYVVTFQGLLLVASVWSVWAFRSRRVFVITFVLSQALACVLAGGDGVYLNIFFGAWFATVLACGIALGDLDSAISGMGTVVPKVGNSAILMCLLFIGVLANLPRDTYREFEQYRSIPSRDTEFSAAVGFLKARPGPAMCESLSLCYEAGKPYEYDPFFVKDQISLGRMQESEIVERFRSHYFQTIQILLAPEEQSQVNGSICFQRDRYLTPNLMRELLGNYQQSMRTSNMLIFVPRAGSL